jgi:long-chain acyl-CoA synthetase
MRHLDRLKQLAECQPAHPALVSDAVSISYSELYQKVKSTLIQCVELGVRENDVVGISVDDEVEHFCLLLSVLGAGASALTLATHDSDQQRSALLKQASVTRVIDRSNYLSFMTDVGAKPTKEFQFDWRERGDGKIFLRTSGTTGPSNIVPFSESQIADQSKRHPEYASERLLRLASIEHNNSKRHRLYSFWQGGTNVFKPRGRYEVVDYLTRMNVTCLDVSLMHVQELLSGSSHLFPKAVKLRTGGTSLPYNIRKRVIEELTTELYVRYAATECGAISMAGPGEHDESEVVGAPLPGVDLKITDQNGIGLEMGAIGLIQIRAEGMASGYLNQSGNLEGRFKGGYFLPGDLGYLRQDGRLVVMGRSDDMIILNGLNIFPVEVERVLERFPGVLCAAVAGLPSQTHGSIPVAVVEVDEGIGLDVEQLYQFSREALGMKAPRKIVIVPSIPRNSQKKVVRSKVVEYVTGAVSPTD